MKLFTCESPYLDSAKNLIIVNFPFLVIRSLADMIDLALGFLIKWNFDFMMLIKIDQDC